MDGKRAGRALICWMEPRLLDPPHAIPSPPQVVDFGVSDGIIRVDCAEVVVDRIALNFIDPKTQKPREKPRTRPEIILRHLTTKSGSVYRYACVLVLYVYRYASLCVSATQCQRVVWFHGTVPEMWLCQTK